MTKHLFAYGTLMFPEIALHVTGCESSPEDAVLHGYQRYAVKDRKFSELPAIIETAGGRVAGKLHRNISEDGWRRLDEFEEVELGLYVRRTVILEGGETAVTYTAGPKLESLLEGSWDPALFEKHYLPEYLEWLVAKFPKTRQSQKDSRDRKDTSAALADRAL